MTVNEKGLEAAREAIIGNPLSDDQLSRIIKAYLRAASNDAEPVAWTSSGNLDGLRDHDSLVIGSMCNRQGDGWTVPLYLTAIEPVAASPGVPDGMARLQGSVPEGWKLVPVEPTDAMISGGIDALREHTQVRMAAMGQLATLEIINEESPLGAALRKAGHRPVVAKRGFA